MEAERRQKGKYINMDTVAFLIIVASLWFIMMGAYCLKEGTLYWTLFLFIIPVALIFAIPSHLYKLTFDDDGFSMSWFKRTVTRSEWADTSVEIVRKMRGRRMLEYLRLKTKDGKQYVIYYGPSLKSYLESYYKSAIPFVSK